MNQNDRKCVEELFQAAVDLAPAERAALLAERCEGDATLRADVEKLLGNYERAMGDFMRSPPIPSIAAEDDGPPERIGAYRLLRKLGEGGFGEVYLAEQSGPVRRQVALKILKLGMDSKQVVARFEAERQAMALMDHPHIAKVFDAGACERGRPYFAMEHVPGLPITAFCDQERLDTEQRLRLFIQVCEAVQHAHQKGVIHRDIKPSNVMVELIDGQAAPKIIDFGVAKALLQPLTEKTMFTLSGQLIGTPEYMSPEQAEMSGLNVDTRTDIYSLGVILYEILTGMLPFDAPTFRTRSLDEIQRMIREDEPAKPSARVSSLWSGSEARERRSVRKPPDASADERDDESSSIEDIARHHRTDPRTLCRELKGDLDWITMKAMEKERTRRYASASELAADIQRHLAHEPVLAGPPGAAYRVSKFVRRNKTAVVSAAIVTLALVGGIIGTSWQAVRATRAEADAQALAELETRRKEAASLLAERYMANYDFLQWGLGFHGGVDPNVADVTVRQMLNAASEQISERYAGQPVSEASVRVTVGVAYLQMSEYDRAILHLQRAYEIEKELPGSTLHSQLIHLGNLVSALREADRREEETQCWLEQVDLSVQLLQERYPDLGAAADSMRRSLVGSARPSDEEVIEHLDAVMTAYAAAMSPDAYDGVAVLHLVLGVGCSLDNTFGVSEGRRRMVEEAYEIARRLKSQGDGWGFIPAQILLEFVRYPARPGEEDLRIARARELLGYARSDIPSYHYFAAAAEGGLGEALVQRGRPEDRQEAVRLLVDSYRKIGERRGPEFFRTKRALDRLAGRSGLGTIMSREQQLYLQHPAVHDGLREGIEQATDAATLHSIARAMVRYPGLETTRYDLALLAAQRADELTPNDSAILQALGAAQYRTGRCGAALSTLARASAPTVEGGLDEEPVGLAFAAMAHHRLGHADEARAALQRLRSLMEDPGNRGSAEREDLLREAVELIGTGDVGTGL